MKTWSEWKEKKNKEGGFDPHGEEETKIFKNADLITLPEGVTGTNCGNCKFVKNGFCTHKKVQQDVTNRMCCKYWDNDGVHRSWGAEQT